MPDLVARFTDKGQTQFLRWLQAGAPGAVPHDLLFHSEFSRPLGAVPVEDRVFPDRYEFGKALVEMLSRLDESKISFDRGLWSWLAARYFDQLCPPHPDGGRQLRKEYVYALSTSRVYYRHLVRTPWYLVKTHGEECRFLLAARDTDDAPLSHQSYLLDQLAARQFVIASPSLIGVARRLYSDMRTGQPTRGAGTKGRGSPRRLAIVANQLSLTYDIHGMPVDELLKLLPEEFGARWRLQRRQALV